MKSALERLREIHAEHRLEADQLLTKYPPDELGEPCPACGSKGRWRWLDGSLICRRGLIQGDHLARASGAGESFI